MLLSGVDLATARLAFKLSASFTPVACPNRLILPFNVVAEVCNHLLPKLLHECLRALFCRASHEVPEQEGWPSAAEDHHDA